MRPKDWLAFLALGLIWGSSFLWIKIAVAEVGPFMLVGLRLLFGILTLGIAILFIRPAWPRDRRTWLSLTFLGIINTGLPYLLISWGEQYIDSAVAAVLNSSAPLFTMIIAHLTLRDDRMSGMRLLAVMLGFAGILLIFSRGFDSGFGGTLLGKGAVILASVLYAFASVYARRTTRGLHPAITALAPLLGAEVLIWGAAPLLESPLRLPVLPLTWFAIAWLGVLGVGAAFLLYFYLLHAIGPTRTVVVTYVFPIVGLILGVFFLNEPLDLRLLTGAALIITSLALVNK
jgi:drug/metabolite transporter (DMT)-like permease